MIQVIQDHGSALVDTGRYREALGAFEAGLAEVNSQAGETRTADHQDERQADRVILYESGHPYHETHIGGQ